MMHKFLYGIASEYLRSNFVLRNTENKQALPQPPLIIKTEVSFCTAELSCGTAYPQNYDKRLPEAILRQTLLF